MGLKGETDQNGFEKRDSLDWYGRRERSDFVESTSTAKIHNNILLGSRCTNVNILLSTSTL